MALNIKWTEEAQQTFEAILAYLQDDWSAKDVQNFINRTDHLLSTIAQQPYLFKASSYKQIRQAVIGKQNSLFYLVRNEEILLLSFWDNRKHPSKNKFN